MEKVIYNSIMQGERVGCAQGSRPRAGSGSCAERYAVRRETKAAIKTQSRRQERGEWGVGSGEG